MSTVSPQRPSGPVIDPRARARAARERLNRADERGNTTLKWLCVGACIVVLVVMLGLVVDIFVEAWPSISRDGLGFIFKNNWILGGTKYGAFALVFGSLLTSVLALIGATVLGVTIGLYLALIAPRWLSRVIGPLVEMLAAVPSIVIGLIGIKVFAPFFVTTIDPVMHTLFGWTSLFGPVPAAGQSYFLAAVVLTFMVLPIIAALTRDIFLTVPSELIQGAEALGATRWEVIRGVVLPTTSSGIIATCVLGFGRAIGEAIAVAQVVGGAFSVTHNLFEPGNTLAATIAAEFEAPADNYNLHALYYCAVLLLIIGIITQIFARRAAKGLNLSIGRRG